MTIAARSRMTRSLLLFSCALLIAFPSSASAQARCSSMAACPAIVWRRTTFGQELATAGINAMLGGITAAAFRIAKGESPWPAFWKGSAGGGLVFVGKRVAVESFAGAGFAGREIASVGGSMVRNASAGRSMFQQLAFPIGPVRVYVGDGPVRLRLDLATAIFSAVFVGAYGAHLDPAASLSSGALVFRGTAPMPGEASAGAMLLWPDLPASEAPRLMAHERVHVLQYDQGFMSWGKPLEQWAMDRGPGKELLRYVDLGGVTLGIRSGLGYALYYHARPWELEAYFLAQRAHPVSHIVAGGR